METIRKTINLIGTYWILLLYGSVFYAYFITGGFPEFSRPDPKAVIPQFNLIFEIYNYVLIVIFTGLVLNIWYVYNRVIKERKIPDYSTWVFLINVLFLVITIMFDPWGFNNWFFD